MKTYKDDITSLLTVVFFLFTVVPHVSENALMMFGSESDQQPTLSQTSTPSPGYSSTENRSTTAAQETIETMRNILDTIIPTQVCCLHVKQASHIHPGVTDTRSEHCAEDIFKY